MRITDLFHSFIVIAALSTAACDGVDDDPQARDLMLAGDLEDDADDADLDDLADADHDDLDDLAAADHDGESLDDRTAAPAPNEGSPALPGLDVSNANDPVAGPPGTFCCADCGGDGVGFYNLGIGDNCNARGWDYCALHFGTALINAEWTSC